MWNKKFKSKWSINFLNSFAIAMTGTILTIPNLSND